MEGEGGKEDCQAGPRPGKRRRKSGKGRPGWQVFLLACCLCCSAADNPEGGVGEHGQGEHRPAAASTGLKSWRTEAQLSTGSETDDETGQNGLKKKKNKKTRTPKKKKALALAARWFDGLFKGKEDTEESEKWVWGAPMSEEERLRSREEAQRRVRACQEAYRVQQEREEARQERLCNVRRSRKAREAAVTICSSLPPRPDNNRPVMYKEVNNDTRTDRAVMMYRDVNNDTGTNRAVMCRDVNEDAAGTRQIKEKKQNGHELIDDNTKTTEIKKSNAEIKQEKMSQHCHTSQISPQSEWEEEEFEWRVELMGLVWALAIYIIPMVWIFADDVPCEY